MKELVYRGQVLYGFLTARRVGTPTPRIVQGSTVVLILRLLFLGSFPAPTNTVWGVSRQLLALTAHMNLDENTPGKR